MVGKLVAMASKTNPKELTLATSVSTRKDVLCSCLPDGESVLLDLDAGVYYGLNSVGTFAWQFLAEPRLYSELIEKVTGEFEIDPAICTADLKELLQELANHDLIRFTQA